MTQWLDPADYDNGGIYPAGTGEDTPLPRGTVRPALSRVPKLTRSALDQWIVRSTLTRPDGRQRVNYYMTWGMWSLNPSEATVFADYEAAGSHVDLVQSRRAPLGWADGSIEVLDIVPLHVEITRGHGAPVQARRDK